MCAGLKLIMAGVDDAQFKGMSKYFNTFTALGRRNIAKATYATLGVIGFLYWAKKKSSGSPEKK